MCKGQKAMDINELITFLDRYPLISACFSHYIRWLADQPLIEVQENDLISALQKGDKKGLEGIETLLSRARETLALTVTEFRNIFGFSNDLLTVDPEKVHDVLAEPVLVVHLAEHGFRKIRKVPRQHTPVADFVAERTGRKYAIELKTIRMENNPKPQPGKFIGNALIPYWWGEMFRNNIITKIEDKGRKVLSQLANTKSQLGCDSTMLALYSRRLSPSTLMDPEDYQTELDTIKATYEEIDYIFFINYSGEVVVYPPLSA